MTDSPLLGPVYGWLVVVLGLGLLALMALLGRYLAEKAKASKVAGVVFDAFEVARSVVAHIEAEMRPKLVSALADGRLTAEERLQLKEQAMRLFKEAVQEKGMERLGKALGLGTAALDVHVSGMVERAVGLQKAAAAVAKLPPSFPTPRL